MRCITVPLIALLMATGALAAEKVERARGRVESVDPAAGRVMIKTHDDRDLELRVSDRSKIELANKPLELAKLQPGQRVRVTYESVGAERRLVTLKARPTGTEGERAEGELLREIRKLAFDQREKYRAELEQVVEDVDDGIADLKRKAKLAAAVAKPQIDRQIEELQKKRDTLKARLDRMKTAGADGWEDIKGGIQEAIEEIRRGLNEPVTPPPPPPPADRLPPK